MKKLLIVAICLSASSAFADSDPKPTAPKTPVLQADLSVNRVEEVYISKDLVTTITLHTKKPVDKISLGSNIIAADFDPTLKQIELRALVTDGVTNMNLIIDGKVYRFLVSIVNDNRRFFAKTYTLAGDDDLDADGLGLGTNAPALRPDRIDVVSVIDTAERARMDAQFRRGLPGMYVQEVHKTWAWNASPVTLQDVTYFANLDLILVRIEFFNRSDKALYLHSKQYRLLAGMKEIPITVRTQLSATVFPGQMDKVYLIIQGQRIDPRNNWELLLPPEGDAVRKMLGIQN